MPTYLPLGWLVKQSHFLITLPKQEGNTWHKSTTIWKTCWGLSHHGYNPTSSEFTFDNIKEAFLAREWNSFHFFGKKLDYLHLKEFLKYGCELHLKWPINTTTTQDHCCLLHLESDLLSKPDGGQLSLSLEIIDYATFSLICTWKWGTLCVGVSPIQPH